MEGPKIEDYGLHWYFGTIAVYKIVDNINEIYNTDIYNISNNKIGTFRDLFNNSIDIDSFENQIDSFMIIYYNDKYYLIATGVGIKNFIQYGNSKYYFLKYHDNGFTYSSNTIEYANNVNYDEIPEYEEEQKQNVDRYSFIQSKDINFVTNYTNIINNYENKNVKVYSNNLITCSYNGQNYGFYFINVPFDNTKNTLNIVNNFGNSINSIDYINGIDVSLMNQYSYSYLGKTFKNILPYINNSNIVTYISNNINIIIKPNIYSLYNKYKQYANKENDKVISYTIYNYEKKYDIELLRYFDEIVPYIPKATSASSYFLYYKNTKDVIENELTNNHISYVMYNKTVSLTKHTNPIYFDYVNKNDYENIKELKTFEFEPLEYKHYNDNKYYCLEKEIIYNFGIVNSYKEMVDLENDENQAYKIFKDRMKNSLDKSLDENRILFLYKKYGRKYSHINIDGDRYTVKIKYYLL